MMYPRALSIVPETRRVRHPKTKEIVVENVWHLTYVDRPGGFVRLKVYRGPDELSAYTQWLKWQEERSELNQTTQGANQ